MRIAVLSGKGGTGKTLVSVNLAAVLGNNVSYVDCDVEEPNGRLFFKPADVSDTAVSVKIPVVDSGLCNGCRKCVSFCKFNALAIIKDKVLVFEEVCHSCGGCELLCPQKAISEKDRVIGKIEAGRSGDVNVFTGILNTGEVSGVPVIRKLLEMTGDDATCEQSPAKGGGDVVIDCPPGCACVVMESIRDADFCILVAEPTIFGVHNLNMVYDLVSMFGKKFGVVLNKCLDDGSENPAETFCNEHGINIVGRIPFSKELGLINSNGDIISRVNDSYKELFAGILDNVKRDLDKDLNRDLNKDLNKEVQNEAASNS